MATDLSIDTVSVSTRLDGECFEHETKHESGGDSTVKSCGSSFSKYYCDHQLGFVVLGATLGIILGVALASWTPEIQNVKDTALLWIGLFGQLFIRALRCVILPLVFSSITISIMDMLALGKAGTVVGKAIGLYFLTTICAAIIGVVTSLFFRQSTPN